jgi:16S rRNA processing protein RimM
VDENGVLIPIGKIVGAHGLKGLTRVRSYAESPEIFKPQNEVIIKNRQGDLKAYRIKSARPQARGYLLRLCDIDDRRQAEDLIGAELLIDKSSLPPLEADTYYWFELIGLSVHTTDGEDLGRIDAIIETGSNDVYVVKKPGDDGSKERLIPAIASVIVEIDLQRQIMRVDLPEGL